MKLTFKLSDNHRIELTQKDNGTVEAASMWKVSGELWSYDFKDFGSIEEAITHYHIAF